MGTSGAVGGVGAVGGLGAAGGVGGLGAAGGVGGSGAAGSSVATESVVVRLEVWVDEVVSVATAEVVVGAASTDSADIQRLGSEICDRMISRLNKVGM